MWQSGLKSEDGNTFSHCSHSWPCFHAAEIIFDTCPQLSEGEQSECVIGRGTTRKKRCHLDLFLYPLCILVLKSAPATFRIWPENPQFPWNAALLFWAAPSRVQLGPKTAWAASQEERVFWNFVVPVWERKSFQILFFFFFCCIKRASACFSEFKVFAFHWSQTASSKHWMSWENFFTG